MQAMILAAGFGTRLLPHSALLPKPLFPVLNTPLLIATICRLRQAGFDRIVVNAHHRREKIRQAITDFPGVFLIEEEEILGTGGGLRGALPHLRPEPLLVTNGDIYHLADFAELYEKHRQSTAPVTMVMHDFPRFNTVMVKNGRVSSFDTPDNGGNLAFTGLHVINPEILMGITPGIFSSIIDHYRALLKKGVSILSHDISGIFWTDMGTETDYLALHAGLLRREIPCWPELALPTGDQLIAGDVSLAENCVLEDWLAIGRARIGAKTTLARAVLWDGVEISGGVYRDCLISQSLEGEKDDCGLA